MLGLEDMTVTRQNGMEWWWQRQTTLFVVLVFTNLFVLMEELVFVQRQGLIVEKAGPIGTHIFKKICLIIAQFFATKFHRMQHIHTRIHTTHQECEGLLFVHPGIGYPL